MLTTLILAAALQGAAPCTTQQPGPLAGQPWVCVNGGWLPPQPVAPAPAPPADPCAGVNPYTDPEGALRCTGRKGTPLRLGRVYVRPGTTERVFVAGTGQLPDGAPLVFVFCTEAGGDCHFAGELRALFVNVNSGEWLEEALP